MKATMPLMSAAMFLLALSTAHAVIVVLGRGACPNPGTQSGFTTSPYLGVWYEYERFPNFFEVGLSCVSATYGDNGDGTISVLNAGLLKVGPFRRPNSIAGQATVPDPSNPAELAVSFGPPGTGGSNPNYFIVDTDYTSYAVVFSCNEFFNRNIQFAWILTRVAGQAPANLSALKAQLSVAGINVNKFQRVDQTDCSR